MAHSLTAVAPWSRLVTSAASYGMGRECGSTRTRVPLYSRQAHVSTVEFGVSSTVAIRQTGTRWDVATRRRSHLLRSAVTRGTRYEPTRKHPVSLLSWLIHLCMIGVVVVESLLSITCLLTTLESYLPAKYRVAAITQEKI